MALGLLLGVSVQGGLRKLGNLTYSVRQDLVARIENPVLRYGTDLWETRLDSKILHLSGGVNQDNRHCFKTDHAFDLRMIVDTPLNPDGSISIEPQVYKRIIKQKWT